MEEKKQPKGLKEVWRKFLVAIKRRPQMIPLVAFVVAFLYYSLNLTHVSNTTARIQGSGMGLAGFATMLFSMLSLLCCLNAFPYRKKTNVPMLVLTIVMVCIIIFADYYYTSTIIAAINGGISVTQNTIYIKYAYDRLHIHMVMLFVGLALTALLPVYKKWLKKINTTVDVGDNGKLDAIDISEE